MQKEIVLKLKPAEALDDSVIKTYISNASAVPFSDITGFYKTKQSIDARSRSQVWINLTVRAYINEPFVDRPSEAIHFPTLSADARKVIIVGAGPAGLFAALQLIELGIQPIILERGKDVRARRGDLAAMNKAGIVNPESNYCFGEGGAGTYSDGKLYTRSSKRGDINRIVVGHHSNIQDNAVVHLADDFPCIIGNWVTIGHSAIVHACTIGDETLIGMGAVVLDGAEVGRQCLIGAKALVTPGTTIPDGALVLGSPAKVVRILSEKERGDLKHWAEKYVHNAAYCLKHGINVGTPLPT